MFDEQALFVVDEAGEHTAIHFRNWAATQKEFFQPQEPELLERIRGQLKSITDDEHSKILAVDLTDIELMPSSLVGVLVAIQKTGIKIELLHPSETVRQTLATMKMDPFFDILP